MKERLKAIGRLLKRMQDQVLLVEGKHDASALRAIGVQAVFVTANGTAESVLKRLHAAFGKSAKRVKRVFLLLDFDTEGLRKQSFYKGVLEENGFTADLSSARKLRSLLGFTCVEESERKFIEIMEKGELNGKNVR